MVNKTVAIGSKIWVDMKRGTEAMEMVAMHNRGTKMIAKVAAWGEMLNFQSLKASIAQTNGSAKTCVVW